MKEIGVIEQKVHNLLLSHFFVRQLPSLSDFAVLKSHPDLLNDDIDGIVDKVFIPLAMAQLLAPDLDKSPSTLVCVELTNPRINVIMLSHK